MGVAREKPSFGCAGEYDRLLARNDGLDFIVLFPPGRTHVVAQAVVEGEIGTGAPTILREQSEIKAAAIRRIRLPLHVRSRSAQQKVTTSLPVSLAWPLKLVPKKKLPLATFDKFSSNWLKWNCPPKRIVCVPTMWLKLSMI